MFCRWYPVWCIISYNEFDFWWRELWFCAFWWRCNPISFHHLQEIVHSSSCSNCCGFWIVWECCISFCGVPCPRHANNHQLLSIQPCCKWCYTTQQHSLQVYLDLFYSTNWLFNITSKWISMCIEWSGCISLLLCISVLGYSCDIWKVSRHMSSLNAPIGER